MDKIDPEILSVAFKDRRLCTRCGTCVGVCPENALRVGSEFYPDLVPSRCTSCGLCAKTCPGERVSFKKLAALTFGGNGHDQTFDGHVTNTYVGYATDSAFRSGGAGGGVITALLYQLLKYRHVDGCIVTQVNPDNPSVGKAYIARTYEELRYSQGSKYTIIPLNSVINRIKNLPGRYAMAALPCQVHGYRLAVGERPELRNKIPYVLGLFCGGSFEPFIISELLKTKGLIPAGIKDFQFRGGEWPGRMRAVLKNGKCVNLHQSNYKDGAYNYLIGMYMPFRCQTCIDGSGKFADLSVSDAWTRNNRGEYKFKSHSKILTRTATGEAIIRMAEKEGALVVNDVTLDPSYRTHKIQTNRKGLVAPLRVARLRRQGKAAPEYDIVPPRSCFIERLKERAISSLFWICHHQMIRF
jgi:coenzyme F420 hydrogenase subunit beta